MTIPSITYALFDVMDGDFLNWNLPSWKSAMNFNADYVNNRNIAILKIRNRQVLIEMSKNANRPTKRPRVDLSLARTKYPLR